MGIVSKVTDAVGLTDSKAGERAAAATMAGSDAAAAAQMEALDFLKSQAALPTEIKDQALKQLQGFYLNPTGQQQMIDTVMSNPMYQQQLKSGEESVLRSASATGGLRGGGSISDVANYQNQLLSQGVNQQLSGLQGLAGMPTNANQIASLMGQIGQTQAAGITGAAQAQAAGNQQNISNLMGLGQLGIGSALAFSDERLKDDIKITSKTSNPRINRYSWVWNNKASELGMKGADSGYLAGEIQSEYPELITVHNSGYKQIDIQGLERKLEELIND